MTLCINGVEIEDTFAEGFKMWGTRGIITGKNRKWALEAATKMTGFATSVIGCKCEAGIEGEVTDTPDGRPGFSVLLFTPSKDDLSKRLMERIGQTVMTCPTTACFNGLVSDTTMSIGGQLRYFGDGYQASKLIGGRRLFTFFFFPAQQGVLTELKKLNWASIGLAIAVVGIEFGFLLVYRSGWNLSLAAVLTNVVASLILLPVAIFVFKDKISWVNISGIFICLIGLVMLNWKR